MLKRENLSDKLADIYGKKIIHNELKSGDLIVETQISKEWGVSRSPVRDALHMLEKQKLVRKDKRGSYVVLELTTSYLRNFHDMVNMFYQYSISKAAKRLSKKDLDYLLSLVEIIEESVQTKNYGPYVESISSFGRTLLKLADNFLIEQFAVELRAAQERIQYFAISISPSHLEKTSYQIRKVYEHLLDNEPEKAEQDFQTFLHIIRNLFPDDSSFKK